MFRVRGKGCGLVKLKVRINIDCQPKCSGMAQIECDSERDLNRRVLCTRFCHVMEIFCGH